MALSRISIASSFAVLVFVSNVLASSSASSSLDDSNSNFSLKRYLETALSIVEALEVQAPESQLGDLEHFRETLDVQMNSVDYLVAFRDDTRIFKHADVKGTIFTGVGVNPPSYAPRPSIRMEYAYNNSKCANTPIGMALAFYALNDSGEKEGHSLVRGDIPFNMFYFNQEWLYEPPQNDAQVFQKVLQAHAEGKQYVDGQNPKFFDNLASQEVRGFLTHTQVVEPYFKRVNIDQVSEAVSNANPYEANMTLLLNFLGVAYDYEYDEIDPADSESDSESGSRSGLHLSPRTNSWENWKESHAEIIQGALDDSEVVAPQWLDVLKELIHFNPMNVKV